MYVLKNTKVEFFNIDITNLVFVNHFESYKTTFIK